VRFVLSQDRFSPFGAGRQINNDRSIEYLTRRQMHGRFAIKLCFHIGGTASVPSARLNRWTGQSPSLRTDFESVFMIGGTTSVSSSIFGTGQSPSLQRPFILDPRYNWQAQCGLGPSLKLCHSPNPISGGTTSVSSLNIWDGKALILQHSDFVIRASSFLPHMLDYVIAELRAFDLGRAFH
jgi:hypothetical protein